MKNLIRSYMFWLHMTFGHPQKYVIPDDYEWKVIIPPYPFKCTRCDFWINESEIRNAR